MTNTPKVSEAPKESALTLDDLNVADLAERGMVVELTHPGTGVVLRDKHKQAYFVEMRGWDSEAVRDLQTRFVNRHMENLQKNKSTGDVKEREAETVAKLCAATIRWYLPPRKDGTELACDHATMKMVYNEPGWAWIPEQLIAAGKDRSRLFTKGSEA